MNCSTPERLARLDLEELEILIGEGGDHLIARELLARLRTRDAELEAVRAMRDYWMRAAKGLAPVVDAARQYAYNAPSRLPALRELRDAIGACVVLNVWDP